MSYFLQKFNHVSVAVNLFTPGTYVPCHNDLYQRFSKVNNVQPNDKIYRFIVMLEQGEHGQMLQINNKVHYKWCSGDYFGWVDQDVHSFYNMSLTNRYAVQVTAV